MDRGRSPQTKEVPPIVDLGPEQELHGEHVPLLELHGTSNGPPEMEDKVAATELSTTKRERYELGDRTNKSVRITIFSFFTFTKRRTDLRRDY